MARTRDEIPEAERPWRFRYGQDVLEVSCPKCAAPVDQECAILRGHVHVARINRRMQARALGIEIVGGAE